MRNPFIAIVCLIVATVAIHAYSTGQLNDFLTKYLPELTKEGREEIHRRKVNRQISASLWRQLSQKQMQVVETDKKEQTVYSWTDHKGVVHLSNVGAPQDRADVEERTINNSSRITKIRYVNKKILVPVKITYAGRETSTTLLLDTGASKTLLHESLANQIGIIPFQSSGMIVADGRKVKTKKGTIDIEVGPHKIKGLSVTIVRQENHNPEFNGLLGMDFLSHFKYDVQLEKQVIAWK